MQGSKKLRSPLKLSCLMVSSLLLVSCAGQQQGEDNLENTNQQGDLGQDDAAEGNGQENFVEEDGQGQEQGEETGEATNNALAEGGNGAPPDGELPPNTNTPPVNEPPPEQTPPLPTNLPPENPIATQAPEAPVATAPADPNVAPITGGRVRYAKSGGAQVVDAPGGSPVGTLEQGDHPVTWEENGWFKLGTGLYVSSDALSNNGVPRSNTGMPWN